MLSIYLCNSLFKDPFILVLFCILLFFSTIFLYDNAASESYMKCINYNFTISIYSYYSCDSWHH